MRIEKVICTPCRTGFFFDDQAAIKAGAEPDGAAYLGKPVTPGFEAVRQVGEAVSIMLVLEDGQVAYGDCAAVQYSGAGGRDPVFLARNYIPLIEKYISPLLIGAPAESFRELESKIESVTAGGGPMHAAIRYGASQAALDAVSRSGRRMMCETIAREYGTEVSREPVRIFSQSGDARYENADKMIMRGADVLPHALINNADTKLGREGKLLLEYVSWLRERILKLRRSEDYAPTLHIDVYGTIGLVFGQVSRIADYCGVLADAASPFRLYIEGPVDAGGREAQAEALCELRRVFDARGIPVGIVADEWCNTLEDIKYFADSKAGHMIQIKTPDLGGIGNTVEAVLYCKSRGMGAYQGGTCNETERSAQVCVHAAMAAKPDWMLAKPGMGVDEGYQIVYNEMQRILKLRDEKF